MAATSERARVRAWLRDARRRLHELRRWLRAPRRLSFTRAGWLFTLGALGVGMAAIPTGNNLLFLLLGSMLGFISVSGWLSEQSIQRLEIERRVPRGITAGRPFRVGYRVRNHKRRLPSLAVEIREPQLRSHAAPGAVRSAWLPAVRPGATVTVRSEHVLERRGVYLLEELTLSTGFPFGLFRKERDLALGGAIVVWPRSDREVREPRTAGVPRRRSGVLSGGGVGARGEFRNLRDYRPGDDPRDVHWRSSARLGRPVMREYERERAEALWLCVDLQRRAGQEESAEEDAIELAASIARSAIERAQPVALATSDVLIEEGSGPAQLERILDALARATFRADAPPPRSPVAAGQPVLVTPAGPRGAGWADVYVARDAAAAGVPS